MSDRQRTGGFDGHRPEFDRYMDRPYWDEREPPRQARAPDYHYIGGRRGSACHDYCSHYTAYSDDGPDDAPCLRHQAAWGAPPPAWTPPVWTPPLEGTGFGCGYEPWLPAGSSWTSPWGSPAMPVCGLVDSLASDAEDALSEEHPFSEAATDPLRREWTAPAATSFPLAEDAMGGGLTLEREYTAPAALALFYDPDALSMRPVQNGATSDPLPFNISRSMSPSPLPESIQEVRIDVLSARYLSPDGTSHVRCLDAYCTCEVTGQPGLGFKTNVTRAHCGDLVWNYSRDVAIAEGETLVFSLMESLSSPQPDITLGTGTISTERFNTHGCQIDLALTSLGLGIAGLLSVRATATISTCRSHSPARSSSPSSTLVLAGGRTRLACARIPAANIGWDAPVLASVAPLSSAAPLARIYSIPGTCSTMRVLDRTRNVDVASIPGPTPSAPRRQSDVSQDASCPSHSHDLARLSDLSCEGIEVVTADASRGSLRPSVSGASSAPVLFTQSAEPPSARAPRTSMLDGAADVRTRASVPSSAASAPRASMRSSRSSTASRASMESAPEQCFRLGRAAASEASVEEPGESAARSACSAARTCPSIRA